MRIVLCSGYFNPIHVGHIDYLTEAKKLGDCLVVIVNNDDQVKVKGSVPFMDEQQRAKIVQSIKGVDLAVVSIDLDDTVTESIEKVYTLTKKEISDGEFFFAKGGDRTLENIPETEVCNKLGIKMMFGVGGEKTESSSSLISDAILQVTRPSLN